MAPIAVASDDCFAETIVMEFGFGSVVRLIT
jgi:hypothetical protein